MSLCKLLNFRKRIENQNKNEFNLSYCTFNYLRICITLKSCKTCLCVQKGYQILDFFLRLHQITVFFNIGFFRKFVNTLAQSAQMVPITVVQITGMPCERAHTTSESIVNVFSSLIEVLLSLFTDQIAPL